MTADPRRLFWTVLWATLLLKLLLAAWIPLTGDEAYFYLWASYPAAGYYDHPPMVGWFLALLLQFGAAEWWLRLPAVLLSTVIGWSIYRLLYRRIEPTTAALVATLYLLSPLNLVAVLVTTDTPLILFSFFSALALLLALERGGYRWFLLSGVLLGLAFLSKYFAVLLGLAYGIFLLLVRRSGRNALGLLLLFLAVLPFAAITLWWNYHHCWDNVLFNLYNRHGGGGAGWSGLLQYLGMMLYLITPPLLWYGWQHRAAFWDRLKGGELFSWLWLLPISLFALLSFVAVIGLHWVLAFYPFLFLSLAVLLERRQLRRSITFMAGFSLLHLALLAVLMLLPLEVWQERQSSIHYSLVVGMHGDELWQEIEPLVGERQFATTSYSSSAILEYATGRRTAVFGDGSKYGRQDDLLTDFRQLDGRGVAVLLKGRGSSEQFLPYFDEVALHPLKTRDIDGYLLVGDGFRYDLYRDEVLRRVQQRFYRLPWFLPVGSCYFYDHYFPQQDVERLPRK
ncbi:MAG: glycosyltransferase family 39 protein [Gammaproteobacteria bacterium]|nr:glycosyltransferase family 39 protein [Gammaproteobacteria bacterium]MCW8959091.1 glycosyltransferase family 39 protein [Gammaproteobacteria bacterium]MCW8973795.1 glycosyltransferase family 39 protein [Gammaproteobacteria bacterium]MCW8991614.1 glycosyltransferase family 39 protein [Gammaproteobacteria bacterium]